MPPTEHTMFAPSSRYSVGARWLLIVFACFAFVSQVYQFRMYVNDDAYITFRYSHSLASGRGPYYNEGEHVEGYTNFLLMLIMAGSDLVSGPDAASLVSKAIGALSGLLCIVLTYKLASADSDHSVANSIGSHDKQARTQNPAHRHSWGNKDTLSMTGVFSAAILGTIPGFALNSMSGLETLLFSMTILLGVYLAFRARKHGRWSGAGIAFGLAALTRPEGTILFFTHLIAQQVMDLIRFFARPGERERLRYFRRWAIRDTLIVLAVVGLHMSFRHRFYDGELLPNTYYAKMGGFRNIGAWEYIRDGALRPFGGVFLRESNMFIAIGIPFAVIGCIQSLGKHIELTPALVLGFFGSLLPFATGSDWMLGWRLITPFLPYLSIMCAMGWLSLVAWVLRRAGGGGG